VKNSLVRKKIPYLAVISKIAKDQQANVWLVGGLLRDLYIDSKKKKFDFDFCVEKKTRSIVKVFSRKISAKFIVLDKKQDSYRVIIKTKNRIYTYDFTSMRGKTFKEDLSLRDFTINTLAINLGDKKLEIIDYFKARQDLRKKIIRATSKSVMLDDPLRILRGFSYLANYGFKIEAKTLKLMAKHKRLLAKVSKERINEELFKILCVDNSYQTIVAMDKLKILDELIPYICEARGVNQGGFHHLDVWNHSLDTLRQFETFYRKNLSRKHQIKNYLMEPLAQKRHRLEIIKLACLLHDIGKPRAKKRLKKRTIFHTHEKIGRDLTDKISVLLRLSLREKEVLKKLIFWHLRPGYLADQIKPSKRAIYRFFRDAQEDGAGVILLSLSDWRATRGPLTNTKRRKKHEKIMLNLLDAHFKELKKKPLQKIVSGHDIMKKFKVGSGPLIGKILKTIKEEQALGRISTVVQAYRIAEKIISKNKKKISKH